MVKQNKSRLLKVLQNLEKKGLKYPKEAKKSKKSSTKKKGQTKSKKTSSKGVVVKGMSVETPEARIGDKVRSMANFNDYGEIVGVDEDTGGWLTTTGKILNPRKQDKTWEVVNYNIYVLTLRNKHRNKSHNLPDGWPFNVFQNSNDNSYNNETNLENVDLMNQSNIEESENSSNTNSEYLKTEMACITAMSPQRAREFLVENELNGSEDRDAYGNFFENSVWFEDSLTSVKYIGTSHFQEEMLLCIG